MIPLAEYYSRSEVQKELYDFCRGRWVALHCLDESGNLLFRRYSGRKPLCVDSLESLPDLLRLKGFAVRSVYATVNVYRIIRRPEDVYDSSNVQYCTSTWDVDGVLSRWADTIAIVKQIVRYLSSRGVEKSVYLKWSGNGCHVHIHEKAFSDSLLEKRHPLDLAYSLIEYVNTKLWSRSLETPPTEHINVENKMDATRVFTSPLSLHRQLDIACICMKPDQLEEFTPEWIHPERFRHSPSWREFAEGEADELAEVAYQAIGGYPLRARIRRRKTKPLDKQIETWLQKE